MHHTSNIRPSVPRKGFPSFHRVHVHFLGGLPMKSVNLDHSTINLPGSGRTLDAAFFNFHACLTGKMHVIQQKRNTFCWRQLGRVRTDDQRFRFVPVAPRERRNLVGWNFFYGRRRRRHQEQCVVSCLRSHGTHGQKQNKN